MNGDVVSQEPLLCGSCKVRMTNQKNAEGLPLCKKCARAALPVACPPRSGVTSALPPAKPPGILPGVGTASKNASDEDALFDDSDKLVTPSSVSPNAGHELDCDALLGIDVPPTTTDAPLTTIIDAPLTTITDAPLTTTTDASPDTTPTIKFELMHQKLFKDTVQLQKMQAKLSALKADVQDDKTKTKEWEDKITTADAEEEEVTKKLNAQKAAFEDLQKQMSAARKVLEKMEEEAKLVAKKSGDLKRKRADYRGADVKMKEVNALTLDVDSKKKELKKVVAEIAAFTGALLSATD